MPELTASVEDARRQKKEKLLQFYRDKAGGGDVESSTNLPRHQHQQNRTEDDVLDIDSASFNANKYLEKQLKTVELSDLILEEFALREQIRGLDSDIQSLMYDNYSKFISATDTIRLTDDPLQCHVYLKLLHQFGCPADELSRLFVNIIDKQFQVLLDQLDPPSNPVDSNPFAGAGDQTDSISTTSTTNSSPSETGQKSGGQSIGKQTSVTAIDAPLSQLESHLSLYNDLFFVDPPTANDASIMEIVYNRKDADRASTDDRSPFNDLQSTTLIGRLEERLVRVVDKCFDAFLSRTQSCLTSEESLRDARHLTHQVDHLYTRLHSLVQQLLSMAATLPSTNGAATDGGLTHLAKRLARSQSLELVAGIARNHVEWTLSGLTDSTQEFVANIRSRLSNSSSYSSLLAPPSYIVDSTPSRSSATDKWSLKSSGCQLMTQLVNELDSSLRSSLREAILRQEAFVDNDNAFVLGSNFRQQFASNDLVDKLLVAFVNHLVWLLQDLSQCATNAFPGSPLLLVLAKFALTWHESDAVENFAKQIEALCLSGSSSQQARRSTRSSRVNENEFNIQHLVASTSKQLRDTANLLLTAFIRIEGNRLASLLAKSVEARDWLAGLEPRSCRSVVKRVVDEVKLLSALTGQLFPHSLSTSPQSTHSASSSMAPSRSHRRTPSLNTNASIGGGGSFLNSYHHQSVGTGDHHSTDGGVDAQLATQLRRLFVQRVDAFVDPASGINLANQSFLVYGVVKIALKTLIECIRLQTLGKFGLQQIQVDCRYLQNHLWQYVSDDKSIQVLLDDVVYSAIQRCVDRQPMEESVLDSICDYS